MNFKLLAVGLASLTALAAVADSHERGRGIHVGERLTLRPYVSFGITYDSNSDSSKHSRSRSSFTISPGVSFDYKSGERFSINGSVSGSYHGYDHYTADLNKFGWSQSLGISWDSAARDAKGWSFRLTESSQMICQDDDMTDTNGRGIWRDRKNFNFSAGLEHRFTKRVHASVSLSTSYLDYDNDTDKYAALYGWSSYTLGGNIGYTFSAYTDFFIGGSYQGYWQDNHKDRNYSATATGDAKDRHVSHRSNGYTLHAGIGTRMTEHVSYSLSGGWTRYDYGGNSSKNDSFTYSCSANWRINERMSATLMGSSYYQPSEREYGAALKNYTVSLGLSRSIIKGKVGTNFNVAYRREHHCVVTYESDDYDEDIITARLGLSYSLTSWLSTYASLEYQTELSHGGGVRNNDYDFDRWRATIGFSLTY